MMRGQLESSAELAAIDRHRQLAPRRSEDPTSSVPPGSLNRSSKRIPGGTPAPGGYGRALKASGEPDVGGQA
jgi:hypothetical protein